MTRVIEADETGRLVLTPEMLGEVKPGTRYIVENLGAGLYLKLEQTAEERQKIHDDWKRHWDVVTEEMSKVWPEGVSAADVISEMRDAKERFFVKEVPAENAKTN